MTKNTYRSNTFKQRNSQAKKKRKRTSGQYFKFLQDRRFQLSVGFFLLIASLFVFIACASYLFTGKADQSVVESVGKSGVMDAGREAKNWMKLWGAVTSHYLIFRWFGIASFLIPPFLFILGYRIVFGKALVRLSKALTFVLFFLFWISLLMGSILQGSGEGSEWGFYSGGLGYELAIIFDNLMGYGTLLFLFFTFLVFVIFFFNITSVFSFGKKKVPVVPEEPEVPFVSPEKEVDLVVDTIDKGDELEDGTALEDWEVLKGEENVEPTEGEVEEEDGLTGAIDLGIEVADGSNPENNKEVEVPVFEVDIAKSSEKIVEKAGHYDPTLDLASYVFPMVDLLNDYGGGKIQVTKEELQQNKDKIVETLTNFKIGIASIKATIGPTVTLYEIVPEAGIKISKIKNLEDDIALSLSALGIRIIAPIPGKGTIGIEVPNKKKELVAMRSVLSTDKFMNSSMALPVALGKTIANEVYVADLAKMPHLLMAGATGQGKSVGLNVILTSLLYKKHPSQLKFVLVDPKKVELTLFNKIERHYLAKLPDSEEAIITDTKKVIYTLNSLCIEMDNRYDLLKDAQCRNIKEYNQKFVERRLNPEKGHRYLPYIILVIDELADLMMTAGKEIESPIARLAQLARAIGIHLVVATQRPSVNVITGVIKANFPARISFRVTSKIDSRTILDAGGADQLVGQGDMLLSTGSDIIRMQCAFVDTPEVDELCEFIGSQRGYDSAYLLPEFTGDDGESGAGDIDLSDRDPLFDEAARLIVAHQQGSTSLIQRKLKLGYNRAGRLIDQLEAAGIVGPFEGSKAREVLIKDEYSLEQLLNDFGDN